MICSPHTHTHIDGISSTQTETETGRHSSAHSSSLNPAMLVQDIIENGKAQDCHWLATLDGKKMGAAAAVAVIVVESERRFAEPPLPPPLPFKITESWIGRPEGIGNRNTGSNRGLCNRHHAFACSGTAQGEGGVASVASVVDCGCFEFGAGAAATDFFQFCRLRVAQQPGQALCLQSVAARVL